MFRLTPPKGGTPASSCTSPWQATMILPYGHYYHCGGRGGSPGSHGVCRSGGRAGTTAYFRRLFRRRAIAPLVCRGLLRGRAFPAAGNVVGPAGSDICRRRRGGRAGVGQLHRPDRAVQRVLALFRPQEDIQPGRVSRTPLQSGDARPVCPALDPLSCAGRADASLVYGRMGAVGGRFQRAAEHGQRHPLGFLRVRGGDRGR